MEEISRLYGLDASSLPGELATLVLAAHNAGVEKSVIQALVKEGFDGRFLSVLSTKFPYLLPVAVRCGANVNQTCTSWRTYFTPSGAAVFGPTICTPLGAAVLDRSIDLAEELILLGADFRVSQGPRSPLLLAVRQRDRTMIEFLLEKGADANYRAEIEIGPLDLALQDGEIQIAQVLLLHGADYRLCSPSLIATCCYDAFEWFVDCSGYSAKAQADEHQSLLFLVCRDLRYSEPGSRKEEEHRRKIQLLLDRGADPALMNE